MLLGFCCCLAQERSFVIGDTGGLTRLYVPKFAKMARRMVEERLSFFLEFSLSQSLSQPGPAHDPPEVEAALRQNVGGRDDELGQQAADLQQDDTWHSLSAGYTAFGFVPEVAEHD